jgi:hypothetical protein
MQCIKYLAATGMQICPLSAFGKRSLGIKRVTHDL